MTESCDLRAAPRRSISLLAFTLISTLISTFNIKLPVHCYLGDGAMVRGRRPNGSLPETKALKQQREFRAKRAEKMVRLARDQHSCGPELLINLLQAELENANRALLDENHALKEANRRLVMENQLFRDHLLSTDSTPNSVGPIERYAPTSGQNRPDQAVLEQMKIVREVQDQLEVALRTIKELSDSSLAKSHVQVSGDTHKFIAFSG